MKSNKKNILPFLLAILSLNAFADEKLWTVSTSLTYRDSDFTLPTNKYSNESWTTNLGLMRKLNDKTYIGGNIAYSNGDINYKSFTGKASIDTPSVSAYILRELAWGLYANGSIGYGKSQIDTNLSTQSYNTDAKFTTASLGLMQYIPFSQNLMSSVSAQYAHISSDTDKFITNVGSTVASSSNSLNYITLGGNLTYTLDKWSPFVRINWLKANREFNIGTGDKDYFGFGAGVNYALLPETSVGFTLGSVFNKRNADETTAGISLSYQF